MDSDDLEYYDALLRLQSLPLYGNKQHEHSAKHLIRILHRAGQ